MRVLVDALPLRQGGGVTYLQQQLAALARVAPDLDLHTLISPWGQITGLPGETEIVPTKSLAQRWAYEVLRLPLRKTDVLYCPANFGPVLGGGPMVLTLQNPNYYGTGLRAPEAKGSRPWWKLKANYAAMKRADAIIAISQSFAEEVAEAVPRVADKITVIHSGAAVWPPQSIKMPGLPERYIVSVTSSAPHKRLEDLVLGWAKYFVDSDEDVSLVIVGKIGDHEVTRHRNLAGNAKRSLLHVGQIRDRSVLKGVYEHATAMVTMSVLESFSMTLSEAGVLGCPLVVSDIPVHREMSMGNALLVPPRRPELLTDVLASNLGGWEPRCRPWHWPVTWEDNAIALAKIFATVSTKRTC